MKRIVGGHQAKPHAWRWQVAVYEQPSWSNSDKDWNFICGASVLNQRFVLCASHCFSSFGAVTNASRIKLMLGAHNRTKNDGIWVKVEKIITHPKYEENLMQNDIALLKLKESVDFTKHNGTIAPVCIGEKKMLDEDLTNEMACVTGWGTTQAMGSVSPVLNEVSVPIVTKENCIKSYDKDSITDCNICAGFEKGQKDSCQGDSGGPLVIRRKDRWIQIGITSWGRGCAEPSESLIR